MTTSAVSPARYSTVAIILHWAIAVLMLFQVGLGFRMGMAQGSARFAVFQLHKSIGITILLLVALRLVWRLCKRPPAITAKPWEKGLAHLVHALFYLLLFALPISGWIIISTSRIVVPTLLYSAIPWPHFPGLAGIGAAAKTAWHDTAEFIHVNLVWLFLGLFLLHVAGALKHHFVDRDGEIGKMAPGSRPGAWLIVIALGVVLATGLGRAWLPIGGAASAMPVAAPKVRVPLPEPAAVTPPEPAAAEAPADNASAAATEEQGPSSWTIAPGSTLRFATSWSGDAIDGGFRRFSGTIDFSPDHLDDSRVEIRIDTASIFSGDAQRDETLKSDDWFAVAANGTATFAAREFRRTGTDRYLASGTLRLKGVTLPVVLPFTLRIDGDKAKMQGSATIDRTDFGIGQGDYETTDEIPAAVKIAVTLNATRR